MLIKLFSYFILFSFSAEKSAKIRRKKLGTQEENEKEEEEELLADLGSLIPDGEKKIVELIDWNVVDDDYFSYLTFIFTYFNLF